MGRGNIGFGASLTMALLGSTTGTAIGNIESLSHQGGETEKIDFGTWDDASATIPCMPGRIQTDTLDIDMFWSGIDTSGPALLQAAKVARSLRTWIVNLPSTGTAGGGAAVMRVPGYVANFQLADVPDRGPMKATATIQAIDAISLTLATV